MAYSSKTQQGTYLKFRLGTNEPMLRGPLCCIQSREEIEDVCMQARVFRAVRKARIEITSKYEVMKYLFVEEMKLIFTFLLSLTAKLRILDTRKY